MQLCSIRIDGEARLLWAMQSVYLMEMLDWKRAVRWAFPYRALGGFGRYYNTQNIPEVFCPDGFRQTR